jgi:hypothetical protein
LHRGPGGSVDGACMFMLPYNDVHDTYGGEQ